MSDEQAGRFSHKNLYNKYGECGDRHCEKSEPDSLQAHHHSQAYPQNCQNLQTLMSRATQGVINLFDNNFALIVNGSPRGVSSALLHQLAAHANTIVAVDSGLKWLDDAQIVPNVLLGDMDSVDKNLLQKYQHQKNQEIETVVVSPIKDQTDIELALDYVQKTECKTGCKNVIVANFAGGRLDQELATLGSLSLSPLRVAAIDDDVVVVFLHNTGTKSSISNIFTTGKTSGCNHLKLSKLGLLPGDEYSVLALQSMARITQAGVRYPQNLACIHKLNGLGISNVVESCDAFVHIWSGSCAVFVNSEP